MTIIKFRVTWMSQGAFPRAMANTITVTGIDGIEAARQSLAGVIPQMISADHLSTIISTRT